MDLLRVGLNFVDFGDPTHLIKPAYHYTSLYDYPLMPGEWPRLRVREMQSIHAAEKPQKPVYRYIAISVACV